MKNKLGRYFPHEIEKKWQTKWASDKIYEFPTSLKLRGVKTLKIWRGEWEGALFQTLFEIGENLVEVTSKDAFNTMP